MDRERIIRILKGNVLILMTCRIIWAFSTSIVTPYLSLQILALEGSPADIGFVNSAGLLAGMVLYPMGGYVADKSGRVKIIGYSTILYALAHIFFVVANHWTYLAVGQFLTRFLLFYMPALTAIEADSIPPDVRGKGFAIVRAIPQAVRIFSPVVGGYAILWAKLYSGRTGDDALLYAVRILWTLTLFAGVLIAWLRLRYLEETIAEEEIEEPLSLKQMYKSIIPSYRGIIDSIKWMSSSLKVIVIIQMFTAFFLAMSAPFYIVYAVEVVGLIEAEWGTILFISGLLGVIISVPSGFLVDELGSRRIILTGMSMLPFLILGFIYTSGFLSMAVVLCGIVICNNILMPAFTTLIANTIPRDRRGRLYSLLGERGIMVSFGRFWGGGFLIFPPAAIGSILGGIVYEYSQVLLYMVTSAAMFVSFILVYLFVHEPKEKNK